MCVGWNLNIFYAPRVFFYVVEGGIQAALFMKCTAPGARTNVGFVPLSPHVDSGAREKGVQQATERHTNYCFTYLAQVFLLTMFLLATEAIGFFVYFADLIPLCQRQRLLPSQHHLQLLFTHYRLTGWK